MRYANLDLDVFDYGSDATTEWFSVRVAQSPAGDQRYDGIERSQPWSRAEIDKALREIAERQLDLGGLIELGQLLADALFPPASVARTLLARSREIVSSDGDGLRIRLKFYEREPARLPWEYLYLDEGGGSGGPEDEFGFLALKRGISIVRFETTQRLRPPPPVAGDVRVAALYANPRKDLGLASEQANLRAALKGAANIELREYEPATVDSLQDAMRRAPHIVHYAGHGRFEKTLSPNPGVSEGKGYLLLSDPDDPGAEAPMAAARFSLNLQSANVRLAVLNACETAWRDQLNDWTGIAPSLVRAGLPAVVGMQLRVENKSAEAFSKHLYMTLGEGGSVDEAVFEGRLAIFNLTEDYAARDWGVPSLYMRSEDGRVFERARPMRRIVFDRVLAEARQSFGGRSDVLDQIDTYVNSRDRGYLVLTAPVGFGKTTLMSRYLDRNPEAAYYFFSRRSLPEQMAEREFLSVVLEQVRRWRKREFAPLADMSVAEMRAEYREQIFGAADLPTKQVLLIDNADDVDPAEWDIRTYLSTPLPKNAFVIISVCSDTDPDRLPQTYGFPDDQWGSLDIGLLDAPGVREALRSMPELAHLADQDDVVAAIMRATAFREDSPGAYPAYLGRLIKLLTSGALKPGQISRTDVASGFLDELWQVCANLSQRQPAVKDVVATLALTTRPIRRADLVELHGSTLGWDQLDALPRDIRRLLRGTDSVGYELMPAQFRRYVQARLGVSEVAARKKALLDYCRRWQNHSAECRYAFVAFPQHLFDEGQADELCDLALDGAFQEEQMRRTGDVSNTLNELLVPALTLALEKDDYPRVLGIVQRCRRIALGGTAYTQVTDLIDVGRFNEAAQRADAQISRPDWSRVMLLMIAWEAAGHNERVAARNAVASAARHTVVQSSGLCDALLGSIAHRLGRAGVAAPEACLTEMGFAADAHRILARATPAQTLGPAEIKAAIDDLAPRVDLAIAGLMGDPEGAGDEEGGGLVALSEPLSNVSANREGQAMIERVLAVALENPYLQYRDVGLCAVLQALFRSPDDAWVQAQLRAALRRALIDEGIGFAFDLPAILVEEAESAARTNVTVPKKLSIFVKNSLKVGDKWGTALFGQSALAAAQFWTRQDQPPVNELVGASKPPRGFSGISSVAMLMLANRCIEFGVPQLADQPKWGMSADQTLFALAESLASNIVNPQFRDERRGLVRECRTWFESPIPHDKDLADRTARAFADPNIRHLYLRFLSACWASPQHRNVAGLKSLVTLAVQASIDGTTYDAILGRLIGIHLKQLSDADLQRCLDVCSAGL